MQPFSCVSSFSAYHMEEKLEFYGIINGNGTHGTDTYEDQKLQMKFSRKCREKFIRYQWFLRVTVTTFNKDKCFWISFKQRRQIKQWEIRLIPKQNLHSSSSFKLYFIVPMVVLNWWCFIFLFFFFFLCVWIVSVYLFL